MSEAQRKLATPTHTAYVVPKGKDGKKTYWHEVGAVWVHNDGKGFDLVLHEGISVHGKIVCRQRKEQA